MQYQKLHIHIKYFLYLVIKSESFQENRVAILPSYKYFVRDSLYKSWNDTDPDVIFGKIIIDAYVVVMHANFLVVPRFVHTCITWNTTVHTHPPTPTNQDITLDLVFILELGLFPGLLQVYTEVMQDGPRVLFQILTTIVNTDGSPAELLLSMHSAVENSYYC